MKIVATKLAGVYILEPEIFADSRGHFLETYNRRTMAELGINVDFVQDNYSLSRKNVLRGLHYQVQQPQGKLVRVARGRVFDVAVDLRRWSSTFGRHIGVELSADNNRMLWIPAGFAHGFVVLSELAGFSYKATDYYAPQHERTILWHDQQLAIKWPICVAEAIVSPKDAEGSPFATAEMYEGSSPERGCGCERHDNLGAKSHV